MWSFDEEAMSFACGSNTAFTTGAVWPGNSRISDCVAAFQTRMDLSPPAVTSLSPSLLNAIQPFGPLGEDHVANLRPVFASTRYDAPPIAWTAMRLPSGDQPAPIRGPGSNVRSRASLFVSKSQTRRHPLPSSLLMVHARYLPLGLKDTSLMELVAS